MKKLGARVLIAMFSLALAVTCTQPATADEPVGTLLRDGFALPVSLSVLKAPTAGVVRDRAVLVYEMQLINAAQAPIVLRTLTVTGDGRTIASYSGSALTQIVAPGGGPLYTSGSRRIERGGSAILFLYVEVPRVVDVPAALTHTLAYDVVGYPQYPQSLTTLPVAIPNAVPLVTDAPVRGSGWYATNGPGSFSGHRRAQFWFDGRTVNNQRFAIDFVYTRMVNGKALAFHGDPKVLTNWYGEGQPLYAVADGRVIATLDGVAEQTPMVRNTVGITPETLAGNNVVIDIGYGRYACYAHLRTGSVRVKRGDFVRAGHVIGELGNSGNSDAPHMHFHVLDSPSFIRGYGVPYAFRSFTTQAASFQGETLIPSGARVIYRDQMPPGNELVTFP